jgi:hypothetical protein
LQANSKKAETVDTQVKPGGNHPAYGINRFAIMNTPLNPYRNGLFNAGQYPTLPADPEGSSFQAWHDAILHETIHAMGLGGAGGVFASEVFLPKEGGLKLADVQMFYITNLQSIEKDIEGKIGPGMKDGKKVADVHVFDFAAFRGQNYLTTISDKQQTKATYTNGNVKQFPKDWLFFLNFSNDFHPHHKAYPNEIMRFTPSLKFKQRVTLVTIKLLDALQLNLNQDNVNAMMAKGMKAGASSVLKKAPLNIELVNFVAERLVPYVFDKDRKGWCELVA